MWSIIIVVILLWIIRQALKSTDDSPHSSSPSTITPYTPDTSETFTDEDADEVLRNNAWYDSK